MSIAEQGKLLALEKLSFYPGFNYFHQIPPLALNFAEDSI